MIRWLDSAYPPSPAQIASAKEAGYGGWAGYFAGTHILNGWSDDDFDRVRKGGLRTLAYCSGWSQATDMRDRAARLGIWICLDDESGIRPHGTWVQPWLQASGAGLYGNGFVHAGHPARFHVLAAYPTSGDPTGTSWNTFYAPRPPGLCGWQWAGSHNFAGRTVDSSWFDDGIAPLLHGPDTGGKMNPVTEEIIWRIGAYLGIVSSAGVAPNGVAIKPYYDAGVVARAKLDTILAAVKAIGTVGGGLTATQQAELDQILADDEAIKAKLDEIFK